jgi:hypothetical protein
MSRRPNYVLIDSTYFIDFANMVYFHRNSNKLIPLKLIDGSIFYRTHNNDGGLATVVGWLQWEARFQENIDMAYKEFCDETFEKQILKPCSCRMRDE